MPLPPARDASPRSAQPEPLAVAVEHLTAFLEGVAGTERGQPTYDFSASGGESVPLEDVIEALSDTPTDYRGDDADERHLLLAIESLGAFLDTAEDPDLMVELTGTRPGRRAGLRRVLFGLARLLSERRGQH